MHLLYIQQRNCHAPLGVVSTLQLPDACSMLEAGVGTIIEERCIGFLFLAASVRPALSLFLQAAREQKIGVLVHLGLSKNLIEVLSVVAVA